MKPIEFDQMTGIAAEHQPQFENLPMYRDDKQIISCWQLSGEELKTIQETGVIWMRLFQSGRGNYITPSLLEADSPFKGSEAKEIQPTATLEEWWLGYYHNPTVPVVFGKCVDDTKNRHFPLVYPIHTSRVDTLQDFKEGLIIATKNSTYKLGKHHEEEQDHWEPKGVE